MVPLLDLKRQYAPLRDEILAELTQICDDQAFILGPQVKAFEQEVAEFLGTKHAIGLSSGTDALLAALMALDLDPGDEVITTPFSFFATAGVIERLRLKPVFVDIDAESFNIAPELVRKAVTPRTKCIMPVHLFGQCADMQPLLELACEIEVPVIEDAAQAIGAEYPLLLGNEVSIRRSCGMGLGGCLSFFPSKNLGAFGDAGMVATNDDTFALKVRTLRVHGGLRTYLHDIVGGNFRIDALQAAVLRKKLPHLPAWSRKRAANAERYRQLFTEHGLDEFITAPQVSGYLRHAQEKHGQSLDFPHIYNQFVIRIPHRDAVREFLNSRQIGCAVYYPLPLHLQPCFAHLGYTEGSLPVAEQASREVLAIPVFPELTDAEMTEVVEALRDAMQQTR